MAKARRNPVQPPKVKTCAELGRDIKLLRENVDEMRRVIADLSVKVDELDEVLSTLIDEARHTSDTQIPAVRHLLRRVGDLEPSH